MGHNYGGKEDPEQQAPIFLQFLDCVHQLLRQFPTKFEFNELLLSFIHDELLNCRFGTFLYNCERERKEEKLSRRTLSIWEFIESNRNDFLNPFFKETNKAVDYIAPNCEIPNLRLWELYYFKYLDVKTPPIIQMETQMKFLLEQVRELTRNK